MLPNINHMEQNQTKIWGHSRPNCPQSPLPPTRTPASCRTSGAAPTELEKADGWGWGWRRGGGEDGGGCPEAISLRSWSRTKHGSELTQRPGEEGRRGLPQTHMENTAPHEALRRCCWRSDSNPEGQAQGSASSCCHAWVRRKAKSKCSIPKISNQMTDFKEGELYESCYFSLSIYIKSFLKRCSTTSSPHATTGSLQKPWSSVSPYQ